MELLTLEMMNKMNIDEIIRLYRNGYTLSEHSTENSTTSKIISAQGISISTGSLLLIIGAIGTIWYLKHKNMI